MQSVKSPDSGFRRISIIKGKKNFLAEREGLFHDPLPPAAGLPKSIQFPFAALTFHFYLLPHMQTSLHAFANKNARYCGKLN